MAEQLPDTISITWHIDDIKCQDATITDDQARKILQELDNGHDATVGINWEVIDTAIEGYKWRLNK